ncbi:MAG TPA: hypothetical protein VFF73_14040 [Planctomycetota bacterium]|nr:hypothetical protein [Planctomycetota bacterium]
MLAVASLAAVVYLASVNAGFLEYDDPHFILEPEVVRAPSLRTVAATLAHPVWGSYHPLHILSYSVDAALWGLARPQGFHATNVALFSLCAALVVLVARSYGLSPRAAALAGVLFAVHPCHVESVAWLSGRKDVLSGVFVLLALLFRERTLPSFAFFFLALAAKTTAVVVAPFLIIDGWLTGKVERRFFPFLVLAAAWIVGDGLAQWSLGAVKPVAGGSRILLVLRSLAWYPLALLHPSFTPHPSLELGTGVAIAVLAAVLGASLLWPGARRGAIVFFLALAPVSNVFPMSNPVQDRYLFLPSIAAALVLGKLLARGRWLVWPVALGAGLLAYETSRYEKSWKSDLDLWSAAVAAEPSSAFAHVALAGARRQHGDLDQAEHEARLSLEEGGAEYALAELANVAVGFAQRGEAGKARHVATTLGPDAHRAWAYVAFAENDLDRATRELMAAGKLPVEDWLTLAANDVRLGRHDEARQAIARALEGDPTVMARVASDPLLGPLVR